MTIGTSSPLIDIRSAPESARGGGLVDRVIDYLRDYVATERLRPGERLPSETKLSLALGVSRPVVREAMRMLAATGLVELAAGKRATIVAVDGEMISRVIENAVLVGQAEAADILEMRRGIEIAMVSLMREVSHRSKNLLAIVLSIAAQTASHAGNIDDFLTKFRGRIQALAWTQDLVTESNWQGTSFQRLVLAQLAQGRGEPPQGIALDGDNPTLGPNAALHVGLAMHELVTNAAAHGALAEGKPGDIEILEQLVSFLGPGKTYCAHAPGAVEPLGSAIKYFRSEFEEGIPATAAAAAPAPVVQSGVNA